VHAIIRDGSERAYSHTRTAQPRVSSFASIVDAQGREQRHVT